MDRIRPTICRLGFLLLGLLLKGIVIFGYFISLTIRLLWKPLRRVCRVLFHFVFVSGYKGYRFMKSQIASVVHPERYRNIVPLSATYMVHVLLGVVAMSVLANNIQARGAQFSEAKPALLSSLLASQNDDEIVMVAEWNTKPRTRFGSGGIGGISPMDVAIPEVGAELAATQESSSLVKPALSETEIGERPRVDVTYHSVEGGETVSQIAEAYGISINTILWENRITDREYIKPGQKLTILPVTGLAHKIVSGDTVVSIAKKYQADETAIIDANKLADASAITTDQVLLVPNGRMPAPVAQPVARFASSAGDSGSVPDGVTAPRGGKLLWPTVSKKINQYFTYRHRGIDIDGNYSSPVYAAEAGRVVSSGWGGGYGLHVVIDHGNGMQTLYGHTSKSFVRPGQFVEKGQTIAMQGCTGWCTGVHVHFEVFIRGVKVNPFSYL